MRQIDWDKRLSDQDVQWLRSSGMRFGPNNQPMEDAIRDNLAGSYEEPSGSGDDPSRSVLDTTAAGAQPFASLSEEEQRTRLTPELEPADDDYDKWPKAELVAEIEERNSSENKSMSTSGTKAELVARLREDDAAA